MPTIFIYKYAYSSCCLDGNKNVPLEIVCVTVMCEGRGSNHIMNTFVIQMRGGVCPDYNSNSDVVQLSIIIEKNAMAPKLPNTKKFRPQTVSAQKDWRLNVLAPKRLGAKTSWR